MKEAKKQMLALKILAPHYNRVPEPNALAVWMDDIIVRPTRKENPGGYLSVEEHRNVRLSLTAELLGKDSLDSYNDLEPLERKALGLFFQRMPAVVLDELRVEYLSRIEKLRKPIEPTANATQNPDLSGQNLPDMSSGSNGSR